MDEHIFAGAYPIGSAQQELGRQAFEHERGALLVADCGRQSDQSRGGNVAPLAIGAATRAHVGHTLPEPQATHTAPERNDDAGRLASWRFGQRPRIQAAAIIDIDEIDADRGVAQLHFPAPWRRQALRLPLQHFGPAVLTKHDGVGQFGLHAPAPGL